MLTDVAGFVGEVVGVGVVVSFNGCGLDRICTYLTNSGRVHLEVYVLVRMHVATLFNTIAKRRIGMFSKII